MTEVRQGPTPRVRFREVSVKRELTVCFEMTKLFDRVLSDVAVVLFVSFNPYHAPSVRSSTVVKWQNLVRNHFPTYCVRYYRILVPVKTSFSLRRHSGKAQCVLCKILYCNSFQNQRNRVLSDDVTKTIFLKLWVLFNCSEQPIWKKFTRKKWLFSALNS